MTLKIDVPRFSITQPSSETSGDGDSFLLLTGELIPGREGQFSQAQSSKYLIGRSPAICGGVPIVIGTRISVHHLIEAITRLGDRERLTTAYPHLSPHQIDAALDYYKQHAAEIDELIEEDRRSEFSKP